MMMTHRIVLKTHPLLTTHVRSVHSILFRSGLQMTKRPEGRHVGGDAKPALCDGGSFLLLVIDREKQRLGVVLELECEPLELGHQLAHLGHQLPLLVDVRE